MVDLSLTNEAIDHSCSIAIKMLKKLLGENLVSVVLFGSCARGDYKEDSDIDIAVLTKSDREQDKNYSDGLAEIATEIAMKTFAVVNFICIPAEEFEQKKGWYLFFKNIANEGRKLYG